MEDINIVYDMMYWAFLLTAGEVGTRWHSLKVKVVILSEFRVKILSTNQKFWKKKFTVRHKNINLFLIENCKISILSNFTLKLFGK